MTNWLSPNPFGSVRRSNPVPHDKYHLREIVFPIDPISDEDAKDLGGDSVLEALYSWHGGQWSAVYSLASTGHSDLVSRHQIDAALDELNQALRGTKGKDRRHLKALISELEMLRDSADEHTAKEFGLERTSAGYA